MECKFNVTGMSCSACSAGVEKAVSRLDGVEKAEVNLLAETMVCKFDADKVTEEDIIKKVEKAGFHATVFSDETMAESENKPMEQAEVKEEGTSIKTRLIASVAFLTLLMYVSMGHMVGLPLPSFLTGVENAVSFALLQFLLTIPVIYLNRKFFIGGFKAVLRKAPNMDTLVAVGSGASLIYSIASIFVIGYGLGHGNTELAATYSHHLYFEGAAMILTLVTVGKYLESRAKGKTNAAVKDLISLAPETAVLLKDGKEVEVPTEQIAVGDILLIRPGSRIPVDGEVIKGTSFVDESALTGESIPVEKQEGDKLISASMNKNGSMQMRATKVGKDTTLSQIITLVENAGATKAPIARLADKVSGVFVPIVMSISLLTVVIWMLVGKDFSFALSLGVAVLVISCPCALGLATPVAITVANGRCAKHGILVKSAEALETLHLVDTVVLDKTGTITEGKPKVTDILTNGLDEKEFLHIAASLERDSEHPLAEAIMQAFGASKPLLETKNFRSVSGRGVTAQIEDAQYLAGNLKFMEEQNIENPIPASEIEKHIKEGKTPMYFAKDHRVIGIIFAADQVKETSTKAIRDMRKAGIDVVMLTGDNKATAKAIGKNLELTDIIADVLPQDKERIVSDIQKKNKKVAMVGDGINDSPALARADVGIAIGSGTDIAIESADIVLMKDDLADVCDVIDFSKKTIRNIKQNLFWAFIYNAIGIPIAAGVLYPAFGITLSPMIAAACMSFSSIFVTTNALRLYKK